MFDESYALFGRYYSKSDRGYRAGTQNGSGKEECCPELSVVIPAYNMQKYLKRCVMSLQKQGCIDLEVIIVNDGSQDATREIAESLARRFSNVRVVSQKNTGPYHARIHGAMEAKGEYLTFVDADDFVRTGFYSSVMPFFEKGDIDILEFGMLKIKNGKMVYRFSPARAVYGSREAIRRQLEKDDTICSNCNKIYKRSLFGKLTFEEDIRCFEEDKLINVKVMSVADRVMSIPDAGYVYDTRDASITTSSISKNYLKILKSSRAVYRYVKNVYPQGSYMAARDLCAHLAFCYINMPEMIQDEKKLKRFRQRLAKEFDLLYQTEGLRSYRPESESVKRRWMLLLFSWNPSLAEKSYRIFNQF